MSPTSSPSRRNLMKFSAGALLTAGLWPGTLNAAVPDTKPFRFLCLNDLHCMDEESGKWLESRVLPVLKQNKEGADFCLLLGDLAEKGTAAELSIVRDLFKPLGLPLHVVPGNHDFAAGDSRSAYDELFPKSLNYTFDHHGWQFIGLDTTDGERYQNTPISADTLAYLDRTLPTIDRSKPIILFTHFPLGEKVTYRPTNAEELLKRFTDHNLRAVLSGHFHGFTERTVKTAVLTTNRCCALKRNNHDRTKEKGFFVCEVKDLTVTRRFIEVPPAA